MPVAFCVTDHIVHYCDDMDPCVGVYILFGLDMAAAAQVHPPRPKKNWGFPSQFIQINQGVNGHTTRAQPEVPHTLFGMLLLDRKLIPRLC